MKHTLVTGILIGLFSFSCTTSPRQSRDITTATLRGPSAMAMLKMINEKPSFDSTHRADFTIRNEPEQVRAMIMEGSVDFAVLPSTMGALIYNKTHDYQLAAVPVRGTLYLFGSDTAIHSWQDLRGKKVYVMARGMTPDIMFRYLAGRHGLDVEKDLVLDYSFPTHIELANAIASGMADLGVISEPLVSMVMKKNPAVHPIIDFNKAWEALFNDTIPFAQTALLVKREFAAQHPGIVSWYLRELRSSINWVNSDPDSAAQLTVKYNILPDAEVAREAIPRCNLHYSNAWTDRKGIEEYFKVFYNFNPLTIGGSLPDETFYYKEQAH